MGRHFLHLHHHGAGLVCGELTAMIRMIFRFNYVQAGIFLLTGFLLSLLLSSSVIPPAPVSEPQVNLVTPYLPGSSGRHFYLTNANYLPNAALTACGVGYHMASLWEILDVSNLTYDYAHPAAYTQADSGYGPPSNWYGWVRTGGSSSNSSTAGSGNCLNWSSNSGSDYGVAVRLSNTWETAPGDISTWDATSFNCTFISPVWCVGNFNTVFLPLIMK